jgi:hypothetical protein
MHSKALELEHMTFENERLQADLAKMEKVWPIFSETLIHFGYCSFLFPFQWRIGVFQILKEKQRKAKNFYLHSQESQKKLVERLSQEEVCKKFPNTAYVIAVDV